VADSKKEKIILIGGGGHCKSVIDVIEKQNKFKIAGIVDVKEKQDSDVLGYKIIASDEELPQLISKYKNVCITVGQIKSPAARIALYLQAKKLNAVFPIIISPTAYVSKHANINEGTIIMHGCIINAGVTIGVNCILNTGSLLEHEAIVGNHCHVSTNACINGQVVLGNEIFVGSSSVINNNIQVASNVIIGSGSVVNKNITVSGIYAGSPAIYK
jgi:sugar O-acyltransferase (sialic acid O-acetyltransferase NeuD family)